MEIKQDLVSKRILYLMKALGLNQKSFAGLLGVTQPAVSKYLKERIPPATVLFKLGQATGTTIEWILTGRHDQKKTMVAEPDTNYRSDSDLEHKLSSLPAEIHVQIIALIDSIVKNM